MLLFLDQPSPQALGDERRRRKRSHRYMIHCNTDICLNVQEKYILEPVSCRKICGNRIYATIYAPMQKRSTWDFRIYSVPDHWDMSLVLYWIQCGISEMNTNLGGLVAFFLYGAQFLFWVIDLEHLYDEVKEHWELLVINYTLNWAAPTTRN